MRELAQDLAVCRGSKGRCLEISRQVDGENVGAFVGGTPRLRVGRAQGYEGWIQAIPYTRVRVRRFVGDGVDSRDALQIRQWRHVHQRKTRHPGVPNPFDEGTYCVMQVLW